MMSSTKKDEVVDEFVSKIKTSRYIELFVAFAMTITLWVLWGIKSGVCRLILDVNTDFRHGSRDANQANFHTIGGVPVSDDDDDDGISIAAGSEREVDTYGTVDDTLFLAIAWTIYFVFQLILAPPCTGDGMRNWQTTAAKDFNPTRNALHVIVWTLFTGIHVSWISGVGNSFVVSAIAIATAVWLVFSGCFERDNSAVHRAAVKLRAAIKEQQSADETQPMLGYDASEHRAESAIVGGGLYLWHTHAAAWIGALIFGFLPAWIFTFMYFGYHTLSSVGGYDPDSVLWWTYVVNIGSILFAFAYWVFLFAHYSGAAKKNLNVATSSWYTSSVAGKENVLLWLTLINALWVTWWVYGPLLGLYDASEDQRECVFN